MISCITTCKGRLRHLMQTAPLIAAEFHGPNVLIDYDCPDDSGDWAFDNVLGYVIVNVSDRPTFHKTIALNLGARKAIEFGADWLCFVDADMRVKPGLRSELERLALRGRKMIGVVDCHTERMGFLFVSRNLFEEVGGYDENFVGWGCEDLDMRLRLLVDAGASPHLVNKVLLEPIKHDDELRSEFQSDTLRSSLRRNHLLLRERMLERQGKLTPEIQALLKYDGSALL